MDTAGIYSKVIGFYPMIGVTESTQRLNAKVVSGTRQSAYDINFVGSWTFNQSGATGDGTNTYWYINYNHNTSGNLYNSHFGTYQTVAGDSAAYDISVAQNTVPGDVFVVMTADYNNSGDGIYDYDIGSSVDYVTCTEPISNMMSFEQSDTKNHVFQNEYIQFPGGGAPNLTKDTYIYGGIDSSNTVYTNRGFGFITFGTLLDDTEMETYQKLMNRFETSMSRNIY
jgi:hypothetical protein